MTRCIVAALAGIRDTRKSGAAHRAIFVVLSQPAVAAALQLGKKPPVRDN
jgi:hypothetical protein